MSVAYHLYFQSPVHFGIEGIGQESIEETFRSDSLWGAILQQWMLLFDDDPDVLCRDPLFTVSSCFPLIGKTRFFPLPIGALDAVMEEAARSSDPETVTVKKWKRVRYIAEPLFRQLLAGKKLKSGDVALDQVYPMQHPYKGGQISVVLHHQEQRPRIRTDQLKGGVNEGDFFYCTDQYFERTGGLFFLADFTDSRTEEKFEAALRLLGDTGVGADRSTGRGYFTFERSYIDLVHDGEDAAAWLLLSLYHPTRDEVAGGVLTDGRSRYTLVRRSGQGGAFLVQRFRRADCWMLAEGSVLPYRVKGDIPLVMQRSDRIPHGVYRNGRAFCFPMSGGDS